MIAKSAERSYEASYVSDYSFEALLVARRHAVALEAIRSARAKRVLEVGCGLTPLAAVACKTGLAPKCWVIIEPSARFRAAAARQVKTLPVEIVPGKFEELVDRLDGPFDTVVMSSLLHEVPRPSRLLAAAQRVLAPHGVLHISVPNAFSIHRRLARAMGLIPSEDTLSDRDRRFGHPVVFDRQRLRNLIERNGFVVAEEGGYFIKPFTHAQMAKIDFLTPNLLDGLQKLGRELPDLAAEIYVNSRLLSRDRVVGRRRRRRGA